MPDGGNERKSARPAPDARPGSARPVLLVILDGWGLRAERDANAVELARTPVYDRLRETCPDTELAASGRAVGLPDGQMGNSEVGHLTIGAGRVCLQEMTRIDDAIASGEFYRNPVLVEAVERVRLPAQRPAVAPPAVRVAGRASASAARRTPAVHVVGLLSDGGVHSHVNHCFALLELARRLEVGEVYVHAFTDGRDTSPTSGVEHVRDLLRTFDRIGVGSLATMVGRYWAMDRDNRWERTRVAYDALTLGEGRRSTDPLRALEESYAAGVTDEFVEPVLFLEEGRILPGDSVVFFNFRSDRARQLARALADPAFDRFAPEGSDAPAGDARAPRERPVVEHLVTLTWYEDDLPARIAFPGDDVQKGLGEVLSGAGLRQLRAAETEKYPHVTYFFNGGLEDPWPGEERLLVPSPKVATYDQQPDMSARELTDGVLDAIRGGGMDAIIVNYANPDMVGHTGSLEAAIAAVETVDHELGRLLEAFPGPALVIADHGNAELMRQPDGTPHTAHTTNPVPCILVGDDEGVRLRRGSGLMDVAPTLLALMGLPVPPEMKGRDLRDPAPEGPAREERDRTAVAGSS